MSRNVARSATDTLDAQMLRKLSTDPTLRLLDATLEGFNLFEAIGVVRQEERHSDLLAFLLDPAQPHGLGDAFARCFLRKALASVPAGKLSVTTEVIEAWCLDGLVVQRETGRVDILLIDRRHELVVVIENKIGSGEHSDQLARYWAFAGERYPGWERIGLYLTPAGEDPSHPAYWPVDYGTVCQAVEVTADDATSLEPSVRILLDHYSQMLRRHIVGDSRTSSLIRQLYAKHLRACDLIHEYRENRQTLILDTLSKLLSARRDLVEVESRTREEIVFAIRGWESPSLRTGWGWTKSGHLLLFDFMNGWGRLDLDLYIGPGDGEIRHRLVALARDSGPPFMLDQEEWPGYAKIFRRVFLTREQYVALDDRKARQTIVREWSLFVSEDLPRLDAAIGALAWL